MQYLIQARITKLHKPHFCYRCQKPGNILYASYEVASGEDHSDIKALAQASGSIKEAMDKVCSSRASEAVYQKTLSEQQRGRPLVHEEYHECFTCNAQFISMILNVPLIGVLTLSRLKESSAIWMMRDIALPNRPSLIETPYQDVDLLLRELPGASVIDMRDSNG